MLRALIYTILGLFVIAVVRMIAGTLAKGVGELFKEETAANAKANTPPTTGGGVLKRDPVCGTYVGVDNSVRKSVNGEVLYFCSTECRDKYAS
jgi:YHS domain-containing protein